MGPCPGIAIANGQVKFFNDRGKQIEVSLEETGEGSIVEVNCNQTYSFPTPMEATCILDKTNGQLKWDTKLNDCTVGMSTCLRLRFLHMS